MANIFCDFQTAEHDKEDITMHSTSHVVDVHLVHVIVKIAKLTLSPPPQQKKLYSFQENSIPNDHSISIESVTTFYTSKPATINNTNEK